MDERNTLRAKLMRRVSNVIYRWHYLVLMVVLAVSVMSWFTKDKLELKLNFTDMLSDEEPAVKHYRAAVEQFGALSYLFVVVESPDLGRSKAYADALAARLLKNPDFVPLVFHKIEFEKYLDYGLLYLKPKELEMLADLAEKNRGRIAEMAAQPGLTSSIEGLNGILSGYVASGEVPEISEDEFDPALIFDGLKEMLVDAREYVKTGQAKDKDTLRRELTARLLAGSNSLPIDLSEPYIVDKEKKRVLMLVSSTLPAEDFEWCRQYMLYVEGEVAALKADFPDVPHPEMTGNAAIMRDDNEVITQDMRKTTLIAFGCIMLLFAFSFRNLSSILMAGVPLSAGIVWSMGAAYLVVGHLTPVTAIFGAILMGLGIDYAILILSRYTEERHRGGSIKAALDTAMIEVGPGILAGASATALAFFSLTQASLKAGREMGVIAGLGIICFVLIMTFGLGSLLVAWDRFRESVGPTQKKFDPKIMRRIAITVDEHPKLVAGVLTIAVIILALIAPRYQFEYNYLNLEPQGIPSIELVHNIPEWFGIDTNYGLIVSRSVEQDRKLAAEIRSKPTVSRVDAVSDFIPEGQPEKLAIISRIDKSIGGIAAGPLPGGTEGTPMAEEEYDKLLAALHGLRDTIGAPGRGLIGLFYLAEMEKAEDGARALLPEIDALIAEMETGGREDARKNLGRLDRKLAAEFRDLWGRVGKMTRVQQITPESLKRDHPELIDRFQGKDGSFVIYSYPKVVIWEEQNLKQVARELREVDPNAMGVAVLFERILTIIKTDLTRVSLIALAVVFLTILAYYRGLWHTLLILTPLVAGGIAMVGMMNIVGLKFNIVNVGMLPLVIGISVDYGVYVVHRWIAEGKGAKSIRAVVESTGRAVTLSALTTAIGFASIVPAKWRGLSLMGGTVAMGIALTWIAAVIYLPAILKVIEEIKEKKKD